MEKAPNGKPEKEKARDKGKRFAREFLAFLKRGNVIARRGIVVGGAFQKIVSSLVNDTHMPLLSLLGKQNLSGAKLVLRPAVVEAGAVVAEEVALMWGSFLQSVIDFFIIGLAIFVALRAMAAFKAEVDRRGRRLFARKMAKETVGQEEANKRRY